MIDRCHWVAAGEEPHSGDLQVAQVVNRNPKYHLLKQTYGTDERLCSSPIRLSVIGCGGRRYADRTGIVEAKC
jgi:hypothetical protein